MINLHLTGDKVISNEQEAFSLNEKSLFGEKKSGKIEYSSVESLFLLHEGKALVFSAKKAVSFDQLMKKLRKQDKKIETKFIVYADLRKRGYVVKSALKFGAEFRVYNKGVRPGEDHAKWILYTSKEHDLLNWHDFTAKNRVAHSTKKNLLIAIVDDESDVSYYESTWLRP
jgi:tRNA-intron endonuclease, archaea type